MSPGVDELEWKESADFSGGLWDRGDDRECPENGLLELTDAYPLLTGGLRAAQRFTAVTESQASQSNYRLIGPFWLQNPEGLYILVWNTTTGDLSLQKSVTTAAPFTGTAFIPLHTWAGITQLDGGIQMASFRTDAVGYRGYFNLPLSTGGSTQGIWRTDGSTATFTFAATRPQGCVSFQARLFSMVDDQGTNDKIIFTEPASHAAPSTANFLRPGGERFGGIKFLAPVQPSDLLTLKYGHGLFLVQGEVTNPLIRELTFAQNVTSQFPVVSDMGIVFVVPDDSVYVWNGSALEDISPNFLGTPMVGSLVIGGTDNGRTNKGNLAHAGHFLYAGGSYVCDLRTRAWFQVSSLTPYEHHAHTFAVALATAGNDNPWIVAGTSPTDGFMSTTQANLYEAAVNEDEMTRARSYSFTLPLIYNPFFQTTVRAAEFYIESFTPEAKVTVEMTVPQLEPGHSETTVTGTWKPAVVYGARPHKVRVNLGPQGADPKVPTTTEWVKFRVTIEGDGQGEAPLLERMALGFAPATRYKADN